MIYGQRTSTYPVQVDAETNYCDLCKYIDEHKHLIKNVGENPSEEEKIFKYLYGILYGFAVKEHYFVTWEDYDKYALYGAGQIYMSMRDKELHAGEERRGKKVQPIKNMLNFIHMVMNPLKVNYQQDNFRLVCDPNDNEHMDTDKAQAEVRMNIQSDYSYGLSESIGQSFELLPKIVHKVVAETPYTDPITLKNLEMSCKLTLLDSVVLPSKVKEDKKSYEALCKAFMREQSNDAILWHLDSGMNTLVQMLVRKIKVKLTEEINEASHQFDLDDNILDAIIASGFEQAIKNDYGEDD